MQRENEYDLIQSKIKQKDECSVVFEGEKKS